MEPLFCQLNGTVVCFSFAAAVTAHSGDAAAFSLTNVWTDCVSADAYPLIASVEEKPLAWTG